MTTTEPAPKRDYFWFYIATAALAAIMIIALVKLDGKEKFDSVRQQIDEDTAKMNIRVLKDY